MLELVRERSVFGYRRIASLLRAEGFRASASRVLRLWRREGLKLPVKKRKKRRLGKSENVCHRQRAEHKGHVWAWDFVFDKTTSGSPLKWLSIGIAKVDLRFAWWVGQWDEDFWRPLVAIANRLADDGQTTVVAIFGLQSMEAANGRVPLFLGHSLIGLEHLMDDRREWCELPFRPFL